MIAGVFSDDQTLSPSSPDRALILYVKCAKLGLPGGRKEEKERRGEVRGGGGGWRGLKAVDIGCSSL